MRPAHFEDRGRSTGQDRACSCEPRGWRGQGRGLIGRPLGVVQAGTFLVGVATGGHAPKGNRSIVDHPGWLLQGPGLLV